MLSTRTLRVGTRASRLAQAQTAGIVAALQGVHAELVVETPDADGVVTTLAVTLDLARARPGTTLSARDLKVLPYLRPAGGTGWN